MTFFDAFCLGLVLDIMKFLDIIVNIEFFLSCASSISSHKCQLVLYMSTGCPQKKFHLAYLSGGLNGTFFVDTL